MRHPNVLRAAPTIAPASSPIVLADLRLRVITPMFGGGVDASTNDPAHLIRPSTIRGHLRFWWRACNAHRYPNLAELHAAERALWGSAAQKDDPSYGPGTIELRVSDISNGEQVVYREPPRGQQQPRRGWYLHGSDPIDSTLGYALFPFAPNGNEPGKSGTVNVTFRLRVTVAPHAGMKNVPDVTASRMAAKQSLWTWIVFGGVGARTRRGCGALHCEGDGDEGIQPGDEHRLPASLFRTKPENIAKWISESLDDCLAPVGTVYRTPIPCLRNQHMLVGENHSDVIPAWAAAIKPLQQFLQGEGVGRNRRKNPQDRESRPGQSFWPEVGAARGLIGFTPRHDEFGDEYTHLPRASATGEQFPRADLGLPRVMKLASDRNAPQVTLERNQNGFTRMASPIILKALPISRNQAIPIVLLLDTPHIWDQPSPGLRLVGNGKPFLLNPVALNTPGRTPIWPRTHPRNVDDPGIISVRDAFIQYVKSRPNWKPIS